NTALEAMVDIICPETHPLAKIAKDVGAAFVLIAAILAIIIGSIIFIPKILEILF
ncbi:MAG: diacylglycerol kinase, partial [Chloroflexi bacterium]|nr:diacylglycerol kinase [Chloroflexota bacterium]